MSLAASSTPVSSSRCTFSGSGCSAALPCSETEPMQCELSQREPASVQMNVFQRNVPRHVCESNVSRCCALRLTRKRRALQQDAGMQKVHQMSLAASVHGGTQPRLSSGQQRTSAARSM